MEYRSEIDGLRAIAVIPVLLFHASTSWCSGGYIGVDVFFVISGYLITSIISSKIDANSFTILGFYERRARRILPALFVTLLFVFLASWFLAMPSTFEDVGRSIGAAVLSISNILFWLEDGYFATASEEKPLLHTWSLGIEEQFYIILPALLVLIGTRRRLLLSTITLCFIGSLILSWALIPKYSSASFFLLPSRAWELLLGSLLAVRAVPRIKNAHLNLILSAGGLVAIAWSAFTFDVSTPFPGLAALLPCLGTAAVIHCGWVGPVKTFLSLFPILIIGRISYSLYLWHWPILVFARQRNIDPLSPTQLVACLLFACVVAWLSWKFIEQPFRKPQVWLTRRRIFTVGSALIAVFAILGASLHLSHGVPGRFSARVVELDSGSDARARVQAQIAMVQWTDDDEQTMFGARVEPRVAVLGDSHSNLSTIVLGDRALKRNESIAQHYIAGCAPILGVRFPLSPNGHTQLENAVRNLESAKNIETVVLMARWALALHGYNADFGSYERDKPTTPQITTAKSTATVDLATATELFNSGLHQIVNRLKRAGKKIILVYPVPEVGYHVPRTMARMVHYGRNLEEFTRPSSYYHQRQKLIFAALDSLGEEGIVRVYPHRFLIQGDVAIVQEDGAPLYRDDDHLNLHGVQKLVQELEGILWPERLEKPTGSNGEQ